MPNHIEKNRYDELIEKQANIIKRLRAALRVAECAGNFTGHIGEMAMHAIDAAMKLSNQYDNSEKISGGSHAKR